MPNEKHINCLQVLANYEYGYYKHLCTGFRGDTSFQFIWEHTKNKSAKSHDQLILYFKNDYINTVHIFLFILQLYGSLKYPIVQMTGSPTFLNLISEKHIKVPHKNFHMCKKK